MVDERCSDYYEFIFQVKVTEALDAQSLKYFKPLFPVSGLYVDTGLHGDFGNFSNLLSSFSPLLFRDEFEENVDEFNIQEGDAADADVVFSSRVFPVVDSHASVNVKHF